MSVYRSAITGADGEVDAGYLGLYAVMVLCLGVIPAAVLLAAVQMIVTADHKLDLVGIAAVVAAAAAGFGTAAGGVGLFRMGDKPHANTSTTSVATSATETVTTAPISPSMGNAAGPV